MKIKVDNRALKRVRGRIKHFKKILLDARERDVNESDTVTIIVDILEEMFGYDRYNEITKEYVTSRGCCDLAIRIGNTLKILIEVKAIGASLKESHIKQAKSYGIDEGIPWVVLTNGVEWNIYYIENKGSNKNTRPRKPIKTELLVSFDLLNDQVIAKYKNAIFALCREGIKKSAIDTIYEYQSFVNKYCIAAILFSDDVKKVIVKNIKKLSKGNKIESNDIDSILTNEILKRDIVDSDEFEKYLKKNKKFLKKKST